MIGHTKLYLPVNFTVRKIDVTINCRPKLSLHSVVFLTSRGAEKTRIHGIHHMLQRSSDSRSSGKEKIKLITDIINAIITYIRNL